jgi:endo-1,4-beta-xylanase
MQAPRTLFTILQALFFSGLALGAFVPSTQGAETIQPLAGGTPLFPKPVESVLKFYDQDHYGAFQPMSVEGMNFKQAVELETKVVPPHEWNLRLSALIPSEIHAGDKLWLMVWIRGVDPKAENPTGTVQFVVERSFDPYDKLLLRTLTAGKEWKAVAIPFESEKNYAVNGTQFCIQSGYKPQTIQIGGIALLNYGAGKKLVDLPRTPVHYDGMEPDAPWRKAAEERIEHYRKAELTINVKDPSGRPLKDAKVILHQTRHGFGFGSCVVTSSILGKGPDFDRYRDIVEHNFTKVVFENDLKWPEWNNLERRKDTLAAIQWLRSRNIDVRGHNLVWPSWQFLPKELQTYRDMPESLRLRVSNHILDEAGATKGLISDWDVINEPYSNHDLQDLFGPGVMVEWFKLARQADPQAKLFLNDYAGFMALGIETAHKRNFEKNIRYLIDSGAPIGGIGIQSHFNYDLTPPEAIIKELDRWAVFGLDIEITEFDIDIDDEELQARYTRDFMTAIFSHPSVSALLTWGFWERQHWEPKAALYRKDWSLKPNGQVWNDLILKEWHTEFTGQTDAQGSVNTRAFIGDYELTVEYLGKTKSWALRLPRDGAAFDAALEAQMP